MTTTPLNRKKSNPSTKEMNNMKFTDAPAEPLAVRPAQATAPMRVVACLSREAMTALYLIVWIASVGASVVVG